MWSTLSMLAHMLTGSIVERRDGVDGVAIE